MNARRKVMEMVAMLHQRGYPSLYLDACMAPSGTYWRYRIAAMEKGRWPITRHGSGECVEGSLGRSGDVALPWGCAAESVTSRAEAFVGNYPKIAIKARAPNADYVEWYRRMMELTSPEGELVFGSDEGPWYEYAYTWGPPDDFRMPMPPGYDGPAY